MPELAGRELRVVDVAGSDALLSSYGERIPVLAARGRELCAPFVRDDVVEWLETLGD